ncbi:hypothetical protein ACFQ2B_38555 [Streptomyces stramineus]
MGTSLPSGTFPAAAGPARASIAVVAAMTTAPALPNMLMLSPSFRPSACLHPLLEG